MMLDKKELNVLLVVLTHTVCGEHGDKHMEICTACQHAQCGACYLRGCQCENDE